MLSISSRACNYIKEDSPLKSSILYCASISSGLMLIQAQFGITYSCLLFRLYRKEKREGLHTQDTCEFWKASKLDRWCLKCNGILNNNDDRYLQFYRH
jgi:hypothetical protein